MEYHGISWNIMEYHGISWNIMEYHGISQKSSKFEHILVLNSWAIGDPPKI